MRLRDLNPGEGRQTLEKFPDDDGLLSALQNLVGLRCIYLQTLMVMKSTARRTLQGPHRN